MNDSNNVNQETSTGSTGGDALDGTTTPSVPAQSSGEQPFTNSSDDLDDDFEDDGVGYDDEEDSGPDCLTAGIALIKQGFTIIPLDHPDRGSKCRSPHRDQPCNGTRGKHPLGTRKKTSCNSVEDLVGWTSGASVNWAILTGSASNILLLDEDTVGHMALLCERIGIPIPDTRRHGTGRDGGGVHWLFRPPVDCPITIGVKLGDLNIDWRGEGGMGIAPGSKHQSGVYYKILNPETPIRPIPDELLELLKAEPARQSARRQELRAKAKAAGVKGGAELGDPSYQVGGRDNQVFSFCVWTKKAGISLRHAEELLYADWMKLEQPSYDTYPWELALSKLHRVHSDDRYEVGDDSGSSFHVDTETGLITDLADLWPGQLDESNQVVIPHQVSSDTTEQLLPSASPVDDDEVSRTIVYMAVPEEKALTRLEFMAEQIADAGSTEEAKRLLEKFATEALRYDLDAYHSRNDRRGSYFVTEKMFEGGKAAGLSDIEIGEILTSLRTAADNAKRFVRESMGDAPETHESGVRIIGQRASDIKPKPVRWLWDTTPPTAPPTTQARIPLNSFSIAAGPGGLGKSQYAVWLTARITTGTLPGEHFGTPHNVIYAATEDDWEMTIAPRLIAAGADLTRVIRIAVQDDGAKYMRLTLPVHTSILGRYAEKNDVVLVVLDPLISHMDGKVDNYRDTEVRGALEPLVSAGQRYGFTILGLMHFTKNGSSDPVSRVSGSGAFGFLVRSMFVFAKDKNTDDEAESKFIMSQVKNNLGCENLPSYEYVIAPVTIETEEGPSYVSKFVLGPEAGTSVEDVLEGSGNSAADREEAKDAKSWLISYLMDQGGEASKEDVLKTGLKEGYKRSTIYAAKAKAKLGGGSTGYGKAKRAVWKLPGA